MIILFGRGVAESYIAATTRQQTMLATCCQYQNLPAREEGDPAAASASWRSPEMTSKSSGGRVHRRSAWASRGGDAAMAIP